MIRILLIRHGVTDLLGHVLYGRMPGIYLNAEGFRQADRLGSMLNSRYKIDEVVSSPLDRATQTAQRVAAAAGIAVEIDPGITEIDFGSWMGKSFQELNRLANWTHYNRNRSTSSPPDGESMLQVQARAWQALERVIHRRELLAESTVAVVSHGDVIRCTLLFLLGMSIDHIYRIEIAPASVSEILLGANGPVVNTINECLH
ncbi:MAG TPA: histidine phosphatase family protein [Bryobacteraceae bacterium]|jgi:probable phosphoglycerate mutase